MTNEVPPQDTTKDNKRGFSNTLMKALLPVVLILAVAVVGLQIIRWKLNEGRSSQQPLQIVDADQLPKFQEGSVLPDFALKTIDGKTTHLSKLGSKVTLLNFWATWCEACMVEMPSIIRLHRMYKDQGLNVVAVDLDDKPRTNVPKVARKLNMDFPVYVDDDGKLADFFDIQAIPITIIMDKNRKILHIEGGERNWADAEMKAKMKQWLGS